MKDIHNITISRGDIVRHIYLQVGFQNDELEQEEIIVIKTNPYDYFSSESISAEIIGYTLDKIRTLDSVHSNIEMRDINDHEVFRGDVVRIYAEKSHTSYNSNYTHLSEMVVMNVGQFYLDSLEYFDHFEIINDEYTI